MNIPLQITSGRDSLSCVETSWWNQSAWQALALLHRTWTGSSTARQPLGTQAGQTVMAQGSSVLSLGIKPSTIRAEQGTLQIDFSLLGTRAPGKLQFQTSLFFLMKIRTHFTKKKKSIKRELFLCLTNLSQENTSTPPPLPLSVDII